MLTWADVSNNFVYLYLISTILTSIASGIVFSITNLISKNKLVSFLAGFSFTPLIQYLFTMIIAFFFSGASIYVFILPLPIISFALILYYFMKNRIRIATSISNGILILKTKKYTFDDIAFISGMVLVIIVIIMSIPYFIGYAGTNAFTTADNGEYIGKAIHFAKTRNISDVIWPSGDICSHFIGDSHFPSFNLFLSYPLMHTGNAIGYPYDKPVFAAVTLVFVYFFIAYSAVIINIIKNKKWIPIALLTFFIIPYLNQVIVGSYRDSFKLLSYMLLIIVLININIEKNKLWKNYILLFVFSFIAMSTHVVGISVIPFLILAWGVYQLFLRKISNNSFKLSSIFIIAFSGLVGNILGFLPNIIGYFSWGTFSSYRGYVNTFEQQSNPREFMDSYSGETIVDDRNIFEKITQPLGININFVGFLSIIIAILFIVLIVFLLARKKTKFMQANFLNNEAVIFLALATAFVFLPITGILDNPITYEFSKGFTAVPRYSIQISLIAYIFLFAFISFANEKLIKKTKVNYSALIAIVFSVILFFLTTNNFVNVISRDKEKADISFIERNESMMQYHAKVKSEGKTTFIYDIRYNYPLNAEAFYIAAPEFRYKLYEKSYSDEFYQNEIDTKKIGMVAVPKNNSDVFITAGFGKYLIKICEIYETDNYKLFIIP